MLGVEMHPEARIHPPENIDVSTPPLGFSSMLNQRFSTLDLRGDSRPDELQMEIIGELVGGGCMYIVNGVSHGAGLTRAMGAQMLAHAWSRTFAERLEEATRRYPDASHDELRQDLASAWREVEKLIATYCGVPQ